MKLTTLDDLHRELWKDWGYRFWYVALWPQYRFLRYFLPIWYRLAGHAWRGFRVERRFYRRLIKGRYRWLYAWALRKYGGRNETR